jgi:hypothetical protein
MQKISRTGSQAGYRGGGERMTKSVRYIKIVEWSDEDQCYVGRCPGLILGGCHRTDEKEVFAELCQIVEETIQLYDAENIPLPPKTSGADWGSLVSNASCAGQSPRDTL